MLLDGMTDCRYVSNPFWRVTPFWRFVWEAYQQLNQKQQRCASSMCGKFLARHTARGAIEPLRVRVGSKADPAPALKHLTCKIIPRHHAVNRIPYLDTDPPRDWPRSMLWLHTCYCDTVLEFKSLVSAYIIRQLQPSALY